MMEGGQLMVVLIVAIVMIASIIRAKYGYARHRHRDGSLPPQDSAETLRLRDEVKELERITVEKENSLSRQIEELRDN